MILAIVITDAPVGYQVDIATTIDGHDFDQWFDNREYARSYAAGLALGTGWPVEDRSTDPGEHGGMIKVTQLNHSQWHAVDEERRWFSGAVSWPAAVAEALWAATLTDQGIESISADGDRLVLLRPSITA